ncbi:hypothetical protein CI610_02466 [invertebrate metagenome]|uniref:Uncharacterized protein n=1 Tax=invertebrate metagenome TaxID=1711999 RepID=A0A2H9T5V8_9ZZZZ
MAPIFPVIRQRAQEQKNLSINAFNELKTVVNLTVENGGDYHYRAANTVTLCRHSG